MLRDVCDHCKASVFGYGGHCICTDCKMELDKLKRDRVTKESEMASRICFECDGTGEVHSHNPRCPSCGGTGKVITVDDGATVDFMTAMRAARDEGKRVRVVSLVPDHRCPSGWLRFRDDGKLICDEYASHEWAITATILGSRWEVEQPKPKEYTFLEAVEMMKAGKTMNSPNGITTWLKDGGRLDCINGPRTLLLNEIEEPKWTEYDPK
jgi:hypothetical protein